MLTKFKTTLVYIFNKKSIRKPFKDQLNFLNQLNPINAKFRETEVSTAYTRRKDIIFPYIIMKLKQFH